MSKPELGAGLGELVGYVGGTVVHLHRLDTDATSDEPADTRHRKAAALSLRSLARTSA
jgi:hypothetical protein